VCALSGDAEGYCTNGYHGDYLRTVGMIVWFTAYTMVYAKMMTLAMVSLLSSAGGIVAIILAQRYMTYSRDGGNDERFQAASWGPSDYTPLVVWWLCAHCAGMLHYRVRFINNQSCTMIYT
jgi:hypothetical protein